MVKEETLTKDHVDFTFISKDPRFDNLTGKVFGNLEILGPYKKEGKTLKWVAMCSCGNIIKTSRTKLMQRGKTSCVKCAEANLRNKHFTPVEQKVSDLYDKREDIVVLERDGDTWADCWLVECKTCGESYKRRYRDLMLGVVGCSCSKYKRKSLDTKIKIVEDYCDEYGFEFVGWNLDSRIKVNLYCPKHDAQLSPHYSNLEKGKICCKGCAKERYTPYNKRTQQEFIQAAKNVHGDEEFDYSLVEYVHSDIKVLIRCNKCGAINSQTPSGHLSGRGCNTCKKTGYKPDEPCYLYIIQLVGLGEVYYKVGITSSIKSRMYNLSLDSWFDITPVSISHFPRGWMAKSVEDSVLKGLGVKGNGVVDRKYFPEGFSETFQEYQLPDALAIVDEELLRFA